MAKTNLNIYEYAIYHFGTTKQQVVAIEEMAELTQALSKMVIEHPNATREAVVEEYTDVLIMLRQLKIIYNISDEEVDEIKQSKLSRLAKFVGYPNSRCTKTGLAPVGKQGKLFSSTTSKEGSGQ